MRIRRVGGSAVLCTLAGCLWLSLATPSPAAPQAGIPAADGGPMLWPTMAAAGDADALRYGFVNTAGERVLPKRYSGYSYCIDADGRAARVLATRGQEIDVLDLDGEVVASLTASSASCVGADHVIVHANGHSGGALVELESQRVIVPAAPGRSITAVDPVTVNVSEPQGEYFLDVATGHRTPHQGRVTRAAREPGAPGVPAVDRADPDRPGRLGYVGRDGAWVVRPVLERATSFVDGHAIVVRDGRASVLDAGLRPMGGDWDRIVPVTAGDRIVGFRVEVGEHSGLLDADLQTVVQPGAARIECGTDAAGACTVVADDGTANLVTLPEGAITAIPGEFAKALGPGLLADNDGDGRTRRVQSVSTGRVVELSAPAECVGVGVAFALCRIGPDRPAVVIAADGEQAPFQHVVAVPDPDPAAGIAYYWVIAGRNQGLVDADGTWLYRERRPTRPGE